MKKYFFIYIAFCLSLPILTCCSTKQIEKTPVDYVNPYMGNISHLLVSTYPTVHLPNSMLRVYPERADYTSDRIKGLPLIVTSHRGSSAFNLSPFQGDASAIKPVVSYSYDQEIIKPYFYSVFLDEPRIEVKYAPSHQSGIYELKTMADKPTYLMLNSGNGVIQANGNTVSGFQQLENQTKVYMYLETEKPPVRIQSGNEKESYQILYLGDQAQTIHLRYGISFISVEQARRNLYRELNDYNVEKLARKGREKWNEALSKIEITNESDENKAVFYTSMYRCYERPVNISEDGRYFSAFDGTVHEDDGVPFYTDDWIWDTYRATHPLRVLTEPVLETNIIRSYIRMAEQMDSLWMPTFPEITGDSRRMNSNHAVATIADACAKGLTDFDVEKAYLACKQGIENKTLAPWSGKPAGWLDSFYKEHGYIPALALGEKETVPEVHPFEKRQPIAVTLGTAYDEWCLSRIADYLKKTEQKEYYLKRSANYRNVFNPQTRFFHPKDKDGKFIEPLDYRYPGGMGAREYYGENNGWVYRWDVPHNIADLILMMGGRDAFNKELDGMFNEPLGRSKYEFYAKLPDHTGNVGQFSMANEPSLHIPYLYNYSGQPWKTQKRIRTLLHEWFRNDLMGVPGDEDGGGMSAFVVFSMMGFYPVTPGSPAYNIGSPMFTSMKMNLGNGKIFEIEAKNCSVENKYIQSATLNGKEWNQPWFNHSDIANGGKLVLIMGNKANKTWGADAAVAPPSANIE